MVEGEGRKPLPLAASESRKRERGKSMAKKTKNNTTTAVAASFATEQEINLLRERMKGIVFRMYRFFPFFGLLVENCKVSIVDGKKKGVPTACVDRHGNISFDKDFFSSLTDDQALFVLAHEIVHAAFSHIDRRSTREPFLWNVAIDYATNLLLADNFSESKYVPQDILLDRKYEGMTAEQIYEDIRKSAKKVKVYTMQGDLDYEGGDSDDNGDGDGEDGDSIVIRERRADKKESEQGWDNAIALAHARAKMQGDMPESLDRAVTSKLQSRVDWREALKQYLRFGVTRILRDHYTFMPPNRRLIHQNIYMPSMYGNDAPKIGFAVDTSGSMGEDEMSAAVAEIDEIRRQFNCPLYVVDCDAEVHVGRWLAPCEECSTSFKGGGGTDFRPVFKHIDDNKVPVDIMVYLTDGYGEFGDEPECDVLWLTTTNVKPPYGEHIQIGVG
jgi:predicted metal-dependent peptidase